MRGAGRRPVTPDGLVQLAHCDARIDLGHLAIGRILRDQPRVDLGGLARDVGENRGLAETATRHREVAVGGIDPAIEPADLQPGIGQLELLDVVGLGQRCRLLVVRGDEGCRPQQAVQQRL